MYLVCFHSDEIQYEANLIYEDEVRKAFSFERSSPGEAMQGSRQRHRCWPGWWLPECIHMERHHYFIAYTCNHHLKSSVSSLNNKLEKISELNERTKKIAQTIDQRETDEKSWKRRDMRTSLIHPKGGPGRETEGKNTVFADHPEWKQAWLIRMNEHTKP